MQLVFLVVNHAIPPTVTSASALPIGRKKQLLAQSLYCTIQAQAVGYYKLLERIEMFEDKSSLFVKKGVLVIAFKSIWISKGSAPVDQDEATL